MEGEPESRQPHPLGEPVHHPPLSGPPTGGAGPGLRGGVPAAAQRAAARRPAPPRAAGEPVAPPCRGPGTVNPEKRGGHFRTSCCRAEYRILIRLMCGVRSELQNFLSKEAFNKRRDEQKSACESMKTATNLRRYPPPPSQPLLTCPHWLVGAAPTEIRNNNNPFLKMVAFLLVLSP